MQHSITLTGVRPLPDKRNDMTCQFARAPPHLQNLNALLPIMTLPRQGPLMKEDRAPGEKMILIRQFKMTLTRCANDGRSKTGRRRGRGRGRGKGNGKGRRRIKEREKIGIWGKTQGRLHHSRPRHFLLDLFHTHNHKYLLLCNPCTRTRRKQSPLAYSCHTPSRGRGAEEKLLQ